MLRLVIALLMLVTPMVVSPLALAQDGVTCGSVETYFRELDQRMFDDMIAFFSDEEWVEDMERMSRKIDASDSGLLTLSVEEMQPFVDLISVPGDVLLDYPMDEIPEIALDFHESSMGYWLIMPAMMRNIGSGGIIAAMIFAGDLEELTIQNLDALEVLKTECPALIEQLEIGAEDWVMADLTELDDLSEINAIEGFAFRLMILPAEGADEADGLSTVSSQRTSTVPSDDYSDLPQQQSPVVLANGEFDEPTDIDDLQFYTGVMLGDPSAPVTMHIFCDFQANFCSSFYSETLPWIIEDFVRSGEINLVLHDFPRLGSDPVKADPDDLSVELGDPANESSLAAQAVMCAGEEGKYLEMSDILFSNYQGVQTGAFSLPNLIDFAEDIGLSTEAFKVCIESGRYVPALVYSVEQARDWGIVAVPMFILDNGDGQHYVIQNTAEGYDLIKRQIEESISTAPEA